MLKREYLAHFIDDSFGGTTTNYVRLGDDLEEYNIELNPDIEVKKNILGARTVKHNGYDVQGEIEPFYATTGSALFTKLKAIINGRLTGDDCKTTVVDVLLSDDSTVVEAHKEDVYVVPTSYGGDTSGVQIPFTIHYIGNRVAGTWSLANSTFTPSSGTSGGGGGGGTS